MSLNRMATPFNNLELTSRGIALHDLIILPLALAAKRIILPQRVRLELIPGKNPPQIRMALEHNAEHVKDLALHPLGPLPDGSNRRNRRLRIIHEALHPKPMPVRKRQQ